jgi:hypothetical protein
MSLFCAKAPLCPLGSASVEGRPGKRQAVSLVNLLKTPNAEALSADPPRMATIQAAGVVRTHCVAMAREMTQ